MKTNTTNSMKIIFFICIIIILITPSINVKAQAATYSIETVQETLNADNGETIAIISYEKPVLAGDSNEISIINQSIENDRKKMFDEYRDQLFSYAQTDYDNKPKDELYNLHYYTIDSVLTNNKNGVFSFKMTSKWYAGGVSSTNYYGLTYSLETGKALTLDDVVEGSSSKIKKRVVSASQKYMSKHPEIGWWNDEVQNALDIIKKYKVSEFKFYLKGNTAYICFDTYELAPGYAGAQIIGIKTKDSPQIDKTEASITIGNSINLKVLGEIGVVKWESNNKSIATVSSKGKVTAKKAGKATITAKVNGRSYSCKITVKSE